MKKTLAQLQEEYIIENDIFINKREELMNTPNVSYEEFSNALDYFDEKRTKISREIRLLLEPVMEDLSTCGTVFSLKEFVENCKDGDFIDYDGSGNYVKDNKMTDITIYPSDVIANKYRKDFPQIIWFNR